jgi:predicted  nucleic acid-binding Zn-ribbon protein
MSFGEGKKPMSHEPENEMSCGKGCQKVEVPTEDELRALNAMREIKERVRELSKKISHLESNSEGKSKEIVRIQGEVERLKEEWKEWEEKRKEAARVRMILLGHEEPD